MLLRAHFWPRSKSYGEININCDFKKQKVNIKKILWYLP